MCYNAMQQSDVANLKLFGPIDRRAESMRLDEPQEADDDAPLTHKDRVAHSSKHNGIYGANITRRNLEASPPDEFHQNLHTVPRVMAFTYRAIMEDARNHHGNAAEEYETYLRDELGLQHNVFVEKDGRIVLKMYGNDCRSLMKSLDKILPDRFLSLPQQREAILQVWEAPAAIFASLKSVDPEKAISPEDFFPMQHMLLLKAQCVFGDRFVTPRSVKCGTKICTS